MKNHLLLFFIFCCYASYGQAIKMLPYTDSANKISVSYPDTWVVKQVPGRVFTFSSPQTQKKDFATASINLVIVPVDSLGKHINNSDVLKILETAYQNEFANYKKIKSDTLQLNGHDGVRLYFQGDLEHVKLKFMTWAFIYKKNAYVFTCKTRQASFDKNAPVFEKIFESFKVNTTISFSKYTDTTFSVSVTPPSDWRLVHDSTLVFAFYSPIEPPHDFAEASISLLIAAAEKATLKDLQSQMQSVCAVGYKDFKKLSSESVNTKKNKGVRLLFTGKREGVDFEVMIYGFIANSKAYLLTCAARMPYFDPFRPVFDTMVSSFEITGVLGYDTYSDTVNKLSLQYPKGWTRYDIEGTALTMSSHRLPMQDFTDATMNLVIAQEQITLSDLLPELEKAYPGQIKNYEKIKSEIITVNSDKCIKIDFKGERENSTLHFVCYTIQHKDKLYSFNFAAREGCFSQYAPVFNKIVESLKIDK